MRGKAFQSIALACKDVSVRIHKYIKSEKIHNFQE